MEQVNQTLPAEALLELWKAKLHDSVAAMDNGLDDLLQSVLAARRAADQREQQYRKLCAELLLAKDKTSLWTHDAAPTNSRKTLSLTTPSTVVFSARGVAIPILREALCVYPRSLFFTMLCTSELHVDCNGQGHVLVDRSPTALSLVLDFLRHWYLELQGRDSLTYDDDDDRLLAACRRTGSLMSRTWLRTSLVTLMEWRDEAAFCGVDPLYDLLCDVVQRRWILENPFHESCRAILLSELKQFHHSNPNVPSSSTSPEEPQKVVCLDLVRFLPGDDLRSALDDDRDSLVAVGGSEGTIGVIHAHLSGGVGTPPPLVTYFPAHHGDVVSSLIWIKWKGVSNYLISTGWDGHLCGWVVDGAGGVSKACMRDESANVITALERITGASEIRTHYFCAGHSNGCISIWSCVSRDRNQSHRQSQQLSPIRSRNVQPTQGEFTHNDVFELVLVKRLSRSANVAGEVPVRQMISYPMALDGDDVALRSIIFAAEGGTIQRWEMIKSGDRLTMDSFGAPLEAHRDSVRCMAVTPMDDVSKLAGCELLATGCKRGDVILWRLVDVMTTDRRCPIPAGKMLRAADSWISDLHFLPKLASSCGAGSVIKREDRWLCATTQTSLLVLQCVPCTAAVVDDQPTAKGLSATAPPRFVCNVHLMRKVALPHADVVRCFRLGVAHAASLSLLTASYDGSVLLWNEASATYVAAEHSSGNS